MPVILNKDHEPVAFICSGKEESEAFVCNGCFLKLPQTLFTETAAFGVQKPSSDYLYDSIHEFLNVQPDDSIKQEILKCIDLAKEKPILFKLTGAFSILAALIEPMKLYKAMIKAPDLLHEALEKVNLWLIDYACSVLQHGVTVLSFADPSGLCELLGKNYFIEFVAKYQLQLFYSLRPFLSHSVVHICGKNSVDLQKCGLIKSDQLKCTQNNYEEELLLRANDTDIDFCGHGCILEEGNAQKCIWKLMLNKN